MRFIYFFSSSLLCIFCGWCDLYSRQYGRYPALFTACEPPLPSRNTWDSPHDPTMAHLPFLLGFVRPVDVRPPGHSPLPIFEGPIYIPRWDPHHPHSCPPNCLRPPSHLFFFVLVWFFLAFQQSPWSASTPPRGGGRSRPPTQTRRTRRRCPGCCHTWRWWRRSSTAVTRRRSPT